MKKAVTTLVGTENSHTLLRSRTENADFQENEGARESRLEIDTLPHCMDHVSVQCLKANVITVVHMARL